MKYSKFGEFMRIHRIKNRETMTDTAKLLGVKLPFVSAVESGKKNVPDGWFEAISDHYKLDAAEQSELEEAIEYSKTQAKLDLTSATFTQRKLVACFQRSLGELDDETANAIMELLKKGDT